MTEAITEDLFLDGRVRLRQPAKGFRAGVDSVLLAAAIEAGPGMTMMEAGCGAGAALICAATLWAEARFIGVERDPAAARLARENAALNGLGDRVAIEEGDALAPGASFDGVFANPPFDDAETAQAPHPSRRGAYLTEHGLHDWIGALSNRLRGGAALTMIHRAARLGEILAALEGRLGGVCLYPIRPAADKPAKRVIVRAVKGARAPLAMLKGLDLHDGGGGKYTPQADAILRGTARVAWR